MTEHHTFNGAPPGEPVKGKTYRADGWAYVDMPAWAPASWWPKAKVVFGEGEYHLLAESTKTTPDGADWWRGQFLVSPTGMANLVAWKTATVN